MKSFETVSEWQKKQELRSKRLKIFGWVLMFASLFSAIFAFTFDWETARNVFESSLTPEEREGYYMIAFVFIVMALFCFQAGSKHKKI